MRGQSLRAYLRNPSLLIAFCIVLDSRLCRIPGVPALVLCLLRPHREGKAQMQSAKVSDRCTSLRGESLGGDQ